MRWRYKFNKAEASFTTVFANDSQCERDKVKWYELRVKS